MSQRVQRDHAMFIEIFHEYRISHFRENFDILCNSVFNEAEASLVIFLSHIWCVFKREHPSSYQDEF